MSLKNILRGTGAAIITPFKKDFTIDYIALDKHIDTLITNGVEYLVTLGSTGETATLSKEEMLEMVHFTFDKVNNRVPVIVGIAGNNTAHLLNNLQSFPLDKATAVLSSSPAYNKPSQEGIFQHFKMFSEACPKPVIIYNVPSRTGGNITATTTVRLANECENIAGIKEASGMMLQCMNIIKDSPKDFLILSGDDHLALPLIACGMDGVISVAANCFPKDFSAMVRAALSFDYTTATKLQYKLMEGMDLLFAENNPAGLKAFLFEMDVIENVLRLPLVPLSADIHKKVKQFMATFPEENFA